MDTGVENIDIQLESHLQMSFISQPRAVSGGLVSWAPLKGTWWLSLDPLQDHSSDPSPPKTRR